MENVLHTAVWMLDTAMVGRLSAEALSAVGFGSQIAYTLVNIVAAIGIGTSALVARFIGAQEPEKANKVVAQSFTISVVISVLLTILNLSFAKTIFSLTISDTQVIYLGVSYVRITSLGIVFLIPNIE